MSSPSSSSSQILPPELWDIILDHLHDERSTLLASSLVCRSWVPTCRLHLFPSLSLSPKHIPRAVSIDALLANPHSTIRSAVRALSLPGALSPIQLLHTRNGSILTTFTFAALLPNLARHLPRVTELALSDYPWPLLTSLKTVERLTLTGVCAGPALLRVVDALPLLAELRLENVTAIPYRGGNCGLNEKLRLPTALQKLSIHGSSIAFLGWLESRFAPSLIALSIDTLVSHELHYLGEYLRTVAGTLQELELAFFDVDPLDALALPTLLEPCMNLKILRLHFSSVEDARAFLAFGGQEPCASGIEIEIVAEEGVRIAGDLGALSDQI
ncbi:hypothetical protein R3P38DRAFT_3047353 [Favolaschia claudopus]|uniref:F-box domain-containing protein n=1 Tax=Favolaschia claudopus TaxID=2862362 RepID=A0AAW0A6A4_9AGAR